jgi:predicted secreted protein
MAFDNSAIVGRDITVFVALVDDNEEPADNEFTELGAVRGLEYGAEWDTTDTTARGTSSGFSRSALVTYKNSNISIDGLIITNDEFQKEVEDHIESPPDEMQNQPRAWVQLVEPAGGGATRIRSQPGILTQFRKSAPFDTEATWTMEVQGHGDPVITDVPAPE